MGEQKRGRRGEICEREGEMGEQKRGRRGEICERGGRDGGTEERETGRDM